MLIAAIHYYRTQSVFISLPIIVALLFALVFVVIGALFAGGMIRREVYVGLMIVAAVILVAALVIAGGLYFFLRLTRRY